MDLLDYGEAHSDLDPSSAHVFQLLVGATFSLWRAVFLASNTRSDPAIHARAVEFLRVVVEDNAITYAEDKRRQDWTYGYYLNNAYFRLNLAYHKLPQIGKDGSADLARRIQEGIDRQAVTGAHKIFSTSEWDLALAASSDVLAALSKEGSSGP